MAPQIVTCLLPWLSIHWLVLLPGCRSHWILACGPCSSGQKSLHQKLPKWYRLSNPWLPVRRYSCCLNRSRQRNSDGHPGRPMVVPLFDHCTLFPVFYLPGWHNKTHDSLRLAQKVRRLCCSNLHSLPSKLAIASSLEFKLVPCHPQWPGLC